LRKLRGNAWIGQYAARCLETTIRRMGRCGGDEHPAMIACRILVMKGSPVRIRASAWLNKAE
jgi:hypothetical protein